MTVQRAHSKFESCRFSAMGGGDPLTRLIVAVMAGAVFAMLAAPSATGAAVSLGQTGAPNLSCGGQFYLVQSATDEAPRYAVPPGAYGVITSWSVEGNSGEEGPGTGRLFVWRPTTAPNRFIYVDSTGPEIFAAGVVRTFAARIPVQAGDVLGMLAPQPCLLGGPGLPVGDQVRFFGSTTEPMKGSTQTTTELLSGFRILIAANVEPDSDRDGFGDETQDQCPTNSTTQGACPAPGAAAGPPPTCKGKPATLVGTSGSDVRTGSQGQDVIVALGGNDTLSGVGGNDVICGGAGKDNLTGGMGKDTLVGQKGSDTLKGGGGNDKLAGKKGKDRLKGGRGKDVCTGGKANDSATCEVEKSI
jgi:RTX calcium-binding nonapeptide repeat (4 copies)